MRKAALEEIRPTGKFEGNVLMAENKNNSQTILNLAPFGAYGVILKAGVCGNAQLAKGCSSDDTSKKRNQFVAHMHCKKCRHYVSLKCPLLSEMKTQ